MIEPGLTGRVALVTGASRLEGMGAAFCRGLAAQGAHVYFTTWQRYDQDQEWGAEADAPQALESKLLAQGIRAGWSEVDLSDPAAPARIFDTVEQALGPVEVLVNNAAHWEPTGTFLPVDAKASDWAGRPQATLTAESHDRIFAMNARATALMMAEYARRHLARGSTWGRIINISTDGADCFPGEVAYGASKAALESYSRSAALELAPYGVTVNIVSPGPTQTGWITPEMEAGMSRSIPLGRVGQPEDVADVVVFLASEQARWLTGQTLYAGGGHRLR